MQPIAYDHLDKIEAILIPATDADADNLADGKTDCDHYALLPTRGIGLLPARCEPGGRSARHHEDNREGEPT